ncbi:hypothetical protein GV827_16245 [Sulfitobacter sp. JBTF-M27]|uniref:Fibronectin-binding protein n=1 Tax=Sulfitobacter sediminilitoris TaxID=2698830 RepID=A0A6P0CCR3_9RHOB|nr:hypothetical protein [Sulfitobacter sediminilitoris]NEK23942.1 hypothetical protein [Sulfitobacter sediminilitoris]
MSAARHVTRRVMLGAFGALLLAAPLPAQQVSISGLYEAQGRNPDGSAYTGQAVISEANGAVQVNWTVGNQSYSGTGVRDGQVVVVNWGQPAPVIYVVMSNGDLYGTWENGTALERLVRQ